MTGKTNAGAEGQKWSIKSYNIISKTTSWDGSQASNLAYMVFDVTNCTSAEIDINSISENGTTQGFIINTDSGYGSGNIKTKPAEPLVIDLTDATELSLYVGTYWKTGWTKTVYVNFNAIKFK